MGALPALLLYLLCLIGAALGGVSSSEPHTTELQVLGELERLCGLLGESANGADENSATEALHLACSRLGERGVPEEQPASILPGRLLDGAATKHELGIGAMLRRLQRTPEDLGIDIPYFANQEQVYPLPLVLTFLAIMAVVVFVFEVLIFRSTLLGKHTLQLLQQIGEQMQDYVTSKFEEIDDEDDDEVEASSTRGAKAELCSWDEAKCKAFWEDIASAARKLEDSGVEASEAHADVDVVGFSQHEFLGYEAKGRVEIVVVRSGPCKAELEVTVCARETHHNTVFKAVAGKEFEAVSDLKLNFSPGEKVKRFDVRLMKDTGGWQPSRQFIVQINGVSDSNVVLSGAKSSRKKPGKEQGPCARVFIAQGTNFPLDNNKFPATTSGDLQLVWTYFMERKRARGIKWWKTLLGLCYEPFHSIVILTVAQKFLLDYGCEPQNPGFNNYWAIAGVACTLAVSVTLLRWASIVVVRNRGRTGGCRMKHRMDLFSKLMNLDHQEQEEIRAEQWIYTTLVDVDSMVSQGYWQSFVMIQNVFALILSILVIFLAELYKSVSDDSRTFNALSFLDTIGIFILLPVSMAFIWRREAHTSKTLRQRSTLEQYWAATFASLVGNAKMIFAQGIKDLVSLESDWEKETSKFVKHHQAARDMLEDTKWATKWLADIFYMLALLYVGFRLFDSNVRENGLMTAGDLVLVLKVYASFGKYLVKVNSSIVGMMRAAVSLRRVAALLDLKEFSHLRVASDPKVVSLDSRDERRIVFKKVRMKFNDQGFEFRTNAGIEPEIRLGGLVRVRDGGHSESTCVAFLKLAAGVIRPSHGEVVKQTSSEVILMPLLPFGVRHNSVATRMMFTGIGEQLAVRTAKALGLDPERRCKSLHVGEAKLLEIFCAMLRDPEVLILDRPLCLLPSNLQIRMRDLLRVWQGNGGAQAILHHLIGNEDAAQDVAPRPPHPLLRQRTLVVTDADMGEALPSSDIILDLSDCFHVSVLTMETEESLKISTNSAE